MKKIVLLILIVLPFLTSCSDEQSYGSIEDLLIAQAYGNGDSSVPALSNSFVELYNPTDYTISLEGSSLQYSESEANWEVFELSKEIKSKTSFLITFNYCADFTTLEVLEGDLTFDTVIENKGIKFCLVSNTTKLTVVDPFNSNVDGYIDMICAAGTGLEIDAAEGEFIVGQSKQKSLRRINLDDTNNNSADFEIIDYSNLANSLIQKYQPKNQKYGTHDFIVEVNIEPSELVIYQVYGTGNNDDGAVNRSFIELYNNSNKDIDLTNYTINYISDGDVWTQIDLTGTIKSKTSYLIVGVDKTNIDNTYYINISDEEADLVTDLEISNKIYSICLLSSTDLLTSYNPYYSFIDGDLNSYIDMVGVDLFSEGNSCDTPSKQKSVVKNSIDTNNNLSDYIVIDLRNDYEIYLPKNQNTGSWYPY